MDHPDILLPQPLRTNLNEMDTQHEALFSEMQALRLRLMRPNLESGDAAPLLADLRTHMALHFAWEEDFAESSGESFASHCKEHQRLLGMMDKKIADAVAGKENIPALLVFLDRSFEAHIRQFDLKFVTALRSRKSGLG